MRMGLIESECIHSFVKYSSSLAVAAGFFGGAHISIFGLANILHSMHLHVDLL